MPTNPEAASGTKGGGVQTSEPLAPAPTGCCTISAPGVPDRDTPDITEAECNSMANAQPGAVAHWVKGDCA